MAWGIVLVAKRRDVARRFRELLENCDGTVLALPGMQNIAFRTSLSLQLAESVRRVQYTSVIRGRDVSLRRTEPHDEMFDPLKAAIVFRRSGMFDEACWMVFLFVHFGRHVRWGWSYARAVYGRCGSDRRWDWSSTSADPAAFRAWLGASQEAVRACYGGGGFGNHRKYQSLDACSGTGTGAAVESYVEWVGSGRGHRVLIQEALDACRGNGGRTFDFLYRRMDGVASFGRTARFDYLCMLGRLRLARVEPASPYIQSSTGPLYGARLLFGSEMGPTQLNRLAAILGTHLGVGMQVLEDALCNWQKSPACFRPFRG